MYTGSVSSALVAAALALTSTTNASPLSPVKPRIGYTVSIPLQLSPRSSSVNGALAILNTYNKYNATAPPIVKAAATKQAQKKATTNKATAGTGKKNVLQTGTVTTTPEPFDVEYLVPVVINGKTFNLVLDSGSSDLWVYSDLQPATQQNGHTTYTTVKSKQQNGQTYSVVYGDGSYSRGYVYTDTASIGGVTATNQAVEAAVDVSSSFLGHVDADGLLGLSMTALNTVRPNQQTTFFDNVKTSLAMPLWTVTIKKGGIGALDFGYVNRTRFTGILNYVDVTPPNAAFWQFNMRRFAINGTDYTTDPFNTIVDTGTSLSYLPDSLIKPYYARIPGAGIDPNWGGYTFPCNAAIPPIGLYIGGIKYTMRPNIINWEQINNTHCLGGIQSSKNLPFAILGDTFLKGVFVAFDYRLGKPRIGFALQNPNA